MPILKIINLLLCAGISLIAVFLGMIFAPFVISPIASMVNLVFVSILFLNTLFCLYGVIFKKGRNLIFNDNKYLTVPWLVVFAAFVVFMTIGVNVV